MATLDGCCPAGGKTKRTAKSIELLEKRELPETPQPLSSSLSRDGASIPADSRLRKKLSWKNPDTEAEAEPETETTGAGNQNKINNNDYCNEISDANGETVEAVLELKRIRSLEKCFNVENECDDLGCTPLILAALDGNLKRTKELLKCPDVDITAIAKGGITALHVASLKGHDGVVAELLQLSKCGVDVQSSDQSLKLMEIRTKPEGFTALHMAACSSNERVVQTFGKFLKLAVLSGEVLRKAMNARDCVERTPLYYAAWNDNPMVASELLSWTPLDVNASDRDGFTALHLSAWLGDKALVGTLLEHEGEQEITDINPNKLATNSVRTYEYLSGLEEKEGDSDVLPRPKLTSFTIKEEHSDVTPLHFAVKKSKEAIVTLLLQHPSVDIHMENREHQSIFDMALDERNAGILWELLDAIKEPHDVWEMVRHQLSMRGKKNFKTIGGDAQDRKQDKKLNHCGELLKMAVHKENHDHIVFLIKMLDSELSKMNEILFSNHSKDEISLLHHAAFAGLGKLVQALSEIPDADVNVADNECKTPLHYAAVMGHANVIGILVNNSQCNVNAEDKYGRTAHQLAVESRRYQVEKLLMDRREVRDYADRFYMNRQVFVDAANTMMLAAALIAGVTFAGWLQPPGGYTPYPDMEIAGAPGTFASNAAVSSHLSMRVFWIFNSLSFFCSIATIIAGAGAVLPTLDVYIAKEVKFVKRTLVATATLLVFAVMFIVVAFAAAGYASLPPVPKYERSMTLTIIFGGVICMVTMLWFLKRLYGIRPSWVRRIQDNMSNARGRPHTRLFTTPRQSYHYSIPR